MSVVTRQTRGRWAVMALAVAALICVPVVASAATSWVGSRDDHDGATPAPRVLMQRAMRSAGVPFSGLATSRGNLGLPDLPQVGEVTAALGGTTRARIWWSAADRWRVAVLTPTGENSVYDDGGTTYTWNYEQAELQRIEGESQLRLPRPDDLMPPQAARRMLLGVSAKDRVEAITGRRRVAGVEAEGIRILPSDERSTIGHVDLWLDPAHALPVAMSVVDAKGTTALESQFTELDLSAPDPEDLRIPPGESDTVLAPDLASRIQRFGPLQLPDRLGGFAASASIVGGTATYGSGLVRFVALPISRRLSNPDRLVEAARSGGAQSQLVTGGETLLISSGALNLVVAQDVNTRRVFVLSGPVDAQVLITAATELFANPPPFRRFRG